MKLQEEKLKLQEEYARLEYLERLKFEQEKLDEQERVIEM